MPFATFCATPVYPSICLRRKQILEIPLVAAKEPRPLIFRKTTRDVRPDYSDFSSLYWFQALHHHRLQQSPNTGDRLTCIKHRGRGSISRTILDAWCFDIWYTYKSEHRVPVMVMSRVGRSPRSTGELRCHLSISYARSRIYQYITA
jgi:hypothetical protein